MRTVTLADVQEFADFLSGLLAPASQAGILAAMKSLFAFAQSQTLSLSVARKLLFTSSSAGGAPLSRRVVLLLFSPRTQPSSLASRMSLATLFLEHLST